MSSSSQSNSSTSEEREDHQHSVVDTNASTDNGTTGSKRSGIDTHTNNSVVSSSARTPVRSHGQRRMPVETAQMNVLGMDADHYLEPPATTATTATTLSPSSAASSSSPKSSNWWQRVLLGSGKSTGNTQANETSNDYSSLDQPLTDHPHSAKSLPTRSTRSTQSASSTVEDQLKQDCSFFYQGMDDNMMTTGPTALRPLRPSAASLANFFSTREGDRYKAKYQQLNQTWIPQNVLPDDLFLDEGVLVVQQQQQQQQQHHQDLVSPFPPQHTRGTSIGTISHSTTQKLSSLIFEQNGRLLMKLPRDQIKLVMDHDLEPGILSVEQWRQPNHDGAEIVPALRVLEEDLKPNSLLQQQQLQPPPLRYVITVPDDLYRRVVAEMSYALIPPCWGFFKCCSSADGRADIRLALVILSVILILLFASTMVWPTE